MARVLPLAMAIAYLFVAGRASGAGPSSPRLKLSGVDLVVLPGPSRAVPHYMSASRDNAVLGIQFFPYGGVSAGVDFAVLGLLGREWEERIGIFGMIELHGACAWSCGIPEPTAFLWRGLFGGSLALSATRLGQKLFGRGGKLEFALSIRHESEHSTAEAPYPVPLADGFIMGDFAMPDIAVRIPVRKLDIELRVQTKVFIPSRLNTPHPDTIYTVGPGFDAIVRWRLHDMIHPFSSTFFEYVVGDSVAATVVPGAGQDPWFQKVEVPDLYLLRTQLGGILVTAIGDLQLFTFLEVGHGEGVLKFYEEVRWGLGTRGVLIR